MIQVKLKDLENHIEMKTVYAPEGVLSIKIYTSEVVRPGLQMAGYFDFFAFERVQVIGKAELLYLDTLSQEVKEERLDKFFSYDVPVTIVANQMRIDEIFLKYAEKYGRILMRTNHKTMKCINHLISYFEHILAPEITVHGILMEVLGVGVLIRGKSGIGKSETALELLKRGHRLIADDAVILKKIDSILWGRSPELTKHLLEIRGIGILDIKHMYGVGAIKIDQTLDLVLDLEEWDPNTEYDRLGIDDSKTNILDVDLPFVLIPVKAGRNIATVVEVAAKNYRQKLLGYNVLDMYKKRFLSSTDN